MKTWTNEPRIYATRRTALRWFLWGTTTMFAVHVVATVVRKAMEGV